MMRKFLAFAALSRLVLHVVAMEPAMEDAIRHGAMAKISYRVIDDEGCPVSNAVAHVWFSSYARHQDDADWLVTTDTNGMFTVEHRTNESLDCGFDKDGYYHSSDQILFRDRKDVPVKVKDGKWQPYGETRTVVLKKTKALGRLSVPDVGQFAVRERKIPSFDCWIPFDLEKFDWNAPYGTGMHPDVLLRFRNRTTSRCFDYTDQMDVCFTNNPFAGAYEMKKDIVSDMKTEYVANTNAFFKNCFSFVCERTADNKRTEVYLTDDSYLVFRTRTTVDENGRLRSAHYGVIHGAWMSGGNYLRITDGCFNPIENNCNIEDSYYLRDKVKHYRDSTRNTTAGSILQPK